MATKAKNLALAAASVDSAGNITADLIDALDSAQFLRSDTDDTMTGNLTVTGRVIAKEVNSVSGEMDTIAYQFVEGRGWGYNNLNDRVFYNAANGEIPFFVDRSTLYTSNDVGIGTSSPSSELDVVGSNGGNGDIKVSRTSGATLLTQAQAALGSFGTTTNHNLQFMTNSGGRMTIDTNGTVGIGTSTPIANSTKTTLHINGDSAGSAIRLSQAASSSLIRFDTTSGLKIGTINSYPLALQTGDVNRLTIDTSGNVGIGTDSPGHKLHIKDSSGSYVYAEGPTSGDIASGFLTKHGSTIAGGFYTNPTHNMTIISDDGINFRLNDSNRIAFKDNGHIEHVSNHTSADKEIRGWFSKSVGSSATDIFTVDVGQNHEGFYYEIITYAGDWGSHSSARSIHRGFINGYNGYTGHHKLEEVRPNNGSITSSVVWSGNSPTLRLQLDTGSVTLRGMIRLVGRIESYTIH